MKKYVLTIIAVLALASMVGGAEKLKSSQVKDIAEQYRQAIGNKNFSAWSKLMLDARGIDEKTFKERIESAAFESVKVEDIDKTKTGYNILLAFGPRVVVVSHENRTSSMSRSSFWVQMLPDGKIKYDILVPHPIPFAMGTCMGSIMQLEKGKNTESGPHLKDYGIPLFNYDSTTPVNEQQKSLRKIKQWLLDEGEEWDGTEPKIPCPEDLFDYAKESLRQFT